MGKKEPMRTSFPFYVSWGDAMRENGFSKSEKADFYEAIYAYGCYGEEPDFKKPILKILWQVIKPLLDKSQKNYENGKKGGSYGRMGGNPNFKKGKRNQYYDNPEDNPEDNPYNNIKNNIENNIESESNINSQTRAPSVSSSLPPDEGQNVAPTVEEVAEYILNAKSGKPLLTKEDAAEMANKFINYYSMKGWNNVRDWRAGARLWIAREKDYQRKPTKISLNNVQPSKEREESTKEYLKRWDQNREQSISYEEYKEMEKRGEI